MCLAVPGKVIERAEFDALVDFQGNRMKVAIMLTPDVEEGDWVLVHAGFAISKIDEAAALETWGYLNEMGVAERAEAIEEINRGLPPETSDAVPPPDAGGMP